MKDSEPAGSERSEIFLQPFKGTISYSNEYRPGLWPGGAIAVTELPRFTVEKGRLQLHGGASHPQPFLPDGREVLEVIGRVPGVGVLVLLDPGEGYAPINNLVLVDDEGSVRWRADLPSSTGGESYVSAEISTSGGLSASSWSGYRVELDPHSGRILSTDWVK